jgi:hypothetical protein
MGVFKLRAVHSLSTSQLGCPRLLSLMLSVLLGVCPCLLLSAVGSQPPVLHVDCVAVNWLDGTLSAGPWSLRYVRVCFGLGEG